MALLNIAVLRWVARLRTDAVAGLRADRGKLIGTTLQHAQPDRDGQGHGCRAGRLRPVGRVPGQGRHRASSGSACPPPCSPSCRRCSPRLNTGLILLVGGLRVVDGALSLGLLVAFQSLLDQLSAGRSPSSPTSASDCRTSAADVTRLRDVERYPVDRCLQRDRAPGRAALPADRVACELGERQPSATARWPTRSSRNCRSTVAPGRRVALVGGSGSGKSTVGKLVAGLYAAVVRADPARRHAARARSRATVLAASVAYVDQDICLFEGTVRDNLTLWDDGVPDEAVIAALRDAAIYDVDRPAPGGIDSLVERGRPQLQRRAAAAAGDGPRAGRGAGPAGPRRGHQRAGPGDRARGRRQPAPARLRLPDHRAPAVHHPRRRRDHRARTGAAVRARQPRGTARAGRPTRDLHAAVSTPDGGLCSGRPRARAPHSPVGLPRSSPTSARRVDLHDRPLVVLDDPARMLLVERARSTCSRCGPPTASWTGAGRPVPGEAGTVLLGVADGPAARDRGPPGARRRAVRLPVAGSPALPRGRCRPGRPRARRVRPRGSRSRCASWCRHRRGIVRWPTRCRQPAAPRVRPAGPRGDRRTGRGP